MTAILAIVVIGLILAAAWGGMRLMQRTTGCACPTPEQNAEQP